MKYKDPHKQILLRTQPYWDRDETDVWIRACFLSMLRCRTAAKGGRVFASATEEKIFFNPCKSPVCPSCGFRAGEKWRAERQTALPNIGYKGITFSMPNVLWTIFHDNPRLAKALPALAAAAIQTRASLKCAAQVGIVGVLHTFNGKIEYNSHVHAIVTAGGLQGGCWSSHIYYAQNPLMESWRKAVIRILRIALEAGQLQTSLTSEQMQKLLTEQERRWWSVRIKSLNSIKHFVEYAGRYIRRPPIAAYRITYIGRRTVTFWYNDKKEHRRKYITCSQKEFIDRWVQHILQRYKHSVRNFGLFAPRSLGQTSAAIFALLGQKRMPRPKARPWAISRKEDFGVDPLVDRRGERMRFIRLLPPTSNV
jgi:hypothetical protein